MKGLPSRSPVTASRRGHPLVRDEKVADLLDSTVQPTYADGTLPRTLTDQSGRRVRYEIRLNRTVFDYIVSNHLWDGRVQSEAKEILFPPPGSQIVKAAWREVDGAAAQHALWQPGSADRSGGLGRRLLRKQASHPEGTVCPRVARRRPGAWVKRSGAGIDHPQ